MQNSPAAAAPPTWMKDSMTKMESELVAKYGEPQKPRILRGLHQVAEFWRADDGDAAAFEDFVRTNFAGDQATLDTMFNRFERLIEQLAGHMHEINRDRPPPRPDWWRGCSRPSRSVRRPGGEGSAP